MISKSLSLLLISLLVIGCSSTPLKTNQYPEKANALLIEAYKLSQNGFQNLAIDRANDAIKLARNSNQISNELIEGYDDLGLYHFLQKKHKASVYYQSIAVTLSHFADPENKANRVYLERLGCGWAYKKYDPTFNFSDRLVIPLSFVCTNQLNIQKNIDIRKFLYKRDVALSKRSGNKLGILKLKKSVCNQNSTL